MATTEEVKVEEPKAKKAKVTDDLAAAAVSTDATAATTAPVATPAATTPAAAASDTLTPQTALVTLPIAVQAKVNELYASGKCRQDELEACCIDSLRDFSDEMAIQIIDKFLESDMSTVRSKTAFFIGILKRFRSKKDELGSNAAAAAANMGLNMYGNNPAMGNPAMGNPAMGMGMMDPAKETALGSIPLSVRYKLEFLFMTGRVMREELETCCIDSLRDFDEVTAGEIVDKFAESDFARVKSKTAFFIGILKRYRQNNGAPMGGGGGGGSFGGAGGGVTRPAVTPGVYNEDKLLAAINSIPASVQAKMNHLFDSNFVGRHEIEPCCVDSLRDFPEDVACQIVDKFAEADMATVRNKTAFFIGVLKRFRGQSGGGSKGGNQVNQWQAQMYATNNMMGGFPQQQAQQMPPAQQMPQVAQQQAQQPAAYGDYGAQQWGQGGQWGAGQWGQQ